MVSLRNKGRVEKLEAATGLGSAHAPWDRVIVRNQEELDAAYLQHEGSSRNLIIRQIIGGERHREEQDHEATLDVR